MFERFTEQARQAIVLAHVEARMLGHDHIGTEHVLLGLASEPDGLAARILERLDITLARIREQVVARVVTEENTPARHVPFDEAATRVVEHAVREADSLGQRSVGTEHLLLGIVRETDGVGAQVLQQFDLDEEKLHAEVIRMLTGPGARLEAFITEAAAKSPPAGAATADFPDVELLSDADLDILIDGLVVEKQRVQERRHRVRRSRLAVSAERQTRRRGRGADV